MLRFVGALPRSQYYVACSGGADSMAVLSFLQNRKLKPKVAYFNHGTEFSIGAQSFVEKYCYDNKLELISARITRDRGQDESPEEYWRNERYKFLNSLDGQVITAHHLNDCIETWIFSSLHGTPKLIRYANKNVIRPFLITAKSELLHWCRSKDVPWIDDPSNTDCRFPRNRIRANIVPEALMINPGLEKVIRKRLLVELNSTKDHLIAC